MTYTHAIFVDESGSGCPTVGINTFWVSVAVAVPISEMDHLENGIRSVIAGHFRQGNKEIKGAGLQKNIIPGTSVDGLCRDVAQLWDDIGATGWGVACKHGAPTPIGCHSPKFLVKDYVRHILMERINGYLDNGHGGDGSYFIVWDISDVRELIDFSERNHSFCNGFNGMPRSARLAPSILGGLSHDWGGLQICDLVANCALHHCAYAYSNGQVNFNQEKKAAFDDFFYPRFQRDRGGRRVGWKYWE